MLQLLLGIAGTGKTTWILSEMQKRAARGAASLLLVPEQFSSSAETLVLEALGDAGSAFVEVLSFRTLAERILRAEGGDSLRILSDAGRAVLVKQALAQAGGGLRRLGRARRDTAFCNLCAQTLAELKTAGATPESLAAVAQKSGDAKLADLALIFSAYEAVLAGSAMDPEDRLCLAAQRATGAFFENKVCYIDNFDGFTAPEYKLLEALMQHSEASCVALCCDALEEHEEGMGLFSPVRATAQRLLQRAQRLGLSCPPAVLLPSPRRSGVSELLAANLVLAGRVPTGVVCSGKLTLTALADRDAEVRLAAAEMRRLACSGVSYGRMALICREPGLYESAVRRQLALFDIPWHGDTPDSIEFSAPVAFLRAALALLRQGLSSAPLLELLKTGLCGCGAAALAALENYVYTWRPRAGEWRQPFTRHPGGLLQQMDDTAAETLALAEGLRAETLPAIEEFLSKAKNRRPKTLSTLLYRLLHGFSAAAHLEENARLLEENGDFAFAQRSRRAWDMAMEMLDQMALLLPDEPVSPAEYDELFLLLVRSTDFGSPPATLESVVFTGAGRMRLADADHCFVLGLLEGEFPAKVGYSGLLTHADRDLLVESGIEMPGAFQNRILLEQMFLYRALTGARQSLHLSWPKRHGGVPGSLSAELTPLVRLLQPGPLALPAGAEAATPAAAFDRLCSLYRENSPEAASLLAALEAMANPPEKLALLHCAEPPRQFTVRDSEALRRLTGATLRVSPTRAERYFTCRFAYYCEHVLRLRPRRPAQLSPLESGSFVHYILEQVLRGAGGGFAQMSDESLRQQTELHATAFIEQHFPPLSPRSRLLLQRIKENAAGLLCYLRDWAQNSLFETAALELDFGPGGAPPLCLEGADGSLLQVTGKVDRVDLLQKDGKRYLCVLDYKTGSRRFELDEVLYGLNMQMLLYMDALCRPGGPYAGALPAGMLYLSSDPAPESGTRGESGGAVYKLDGLLLDDPAVLEALDSDKSGLFLPVKYKKDGQPAASRHLASLQRIGGLGLYIEEMLAEMAGGLAAGDFAAKPLVKSGAPRHCGYCPFRAACRHEDGKNELPLVKQDDVWEKIDALSGKAGEVHGGA